MYFVTVSADVCQVPGPIPMNGQTSSCVLPAAMPSSGCQSDHLAYFVSDVVDQLELFEITARYERESRGGPPYHPRMMVKVLLYGYCVGVASSRRIAQRLHEDIAFRVLAANNTPDFRTISDFRKDNLDALSGLFRKQLQGAPAVLHRVVSANPAPVLQA